MNTLELKNNILSLLIDINDYEKLTDIYKYLQSLEQEETSLIPLSIEKKIIIATKNDMNNTASRCYNAILHTNSKYEGYWVSYIYLAYNSGDMGVGRESRWLHFNKTGEFIASNPKFDTINEDNTWFNAMAEIKALDFSQI